MIERAFWFSEKKTDVAGTQGHPRNATGGIEELVNSGTSYVQDEGGALMTAPDFNIFLREALNYGSDSRSLFCGGKVISAINEIARGQIQTRVGDTVYGLAINEWHSAFGRIKFLHNPLFIGTYSGWGFSLDLDCFKYAFMRGRDTKLETNIQGNDVDGEVDQYITEVGLQRAKAPYHALVKNVEG